MMNKFFFVIFCLAFSVLFTYSQSSYFHNGMTHYEMEEFSIAKSFFINSYLFENTNEELIYLIAKCSKEINSNDVEDWYNLLLEETNNNSKYYYLALKDMSLIHFDRGEFENSRMFLMSIRSSSLFDDELYFKLGYCFLQEGEFDEAKYCFENIHDISSAYYIPSIYYYGHIAYEQKLYSVSLDKMNSLLDQKVYGNIASYYISQILFKQNQYQKVVDFVIPILDNSVNSRKKELYRILAESYYRLESYINADMFFDKYLEIEKNPSMLDNFQIGQTNIFLGNFEKAIFFLEQVSGVPDSLRQFNAYYLGKAYLESENKTYALNAFKEAADINYDYDIKEESLYNYFKLSYELDLPYSNLSDIIQIMDDLNFTKYKSELEELILNLFQSTRKYGEAYDFLKNKYPLTKNDKKSLQRLSYFIGIQLYNDGNFNNALLFFESSLLYPINQEIFDMTLYWLGDCFYQMNDFQNSINLYNNFLNKTSKSYFEKYNNAQYNLAYSYYKIRDYDSAIKYFRKFLITLNTDTLRRVDAYLRLADSYYLLSNFVMANENYTIVENYNVFDQDYAIYQKSKCAALLSDFTNQEKELLKLHERFKNSVYYEKSVYDLANLYKSIEKNNLAIKYYNKVISLTSNSELLAKSLYNKSLAFENLSMIDSSIVTLRKVIQDFRLTSSFRNARLGLKDLYVNLGQVDTYLRFINTIPQIDVSEQSKDSLLYQSALINFKKKSFSKSKIDFINYYEYFGENGIFYIGSCYYLSESYWTLNDTLNAIEVSEKLVRISNVKNTEFYEPTILRLTRYFYYTENYYMSNEYYKILDSIASDNNLYRESITRLMLGYEEIDDSLSVQYAYRVLEMDKLDDRLLARSKLIIARYDFVNGNYLRSFNYCNEVASLTNNKDGAEALFMVTYFEYLQENYDKAESLIFDLAENYSSPLWIGEGFLLLAEIYLKTGNTYQAKATLESLIKHHQNVDLVTRAQLKIEEILIHDIEVLNKTKKSDVKINFEELEILDYEEF